MKNLILFCFLIPVLALAQVNIFININGGLVNSITVGTNAVPVPPPVTNIVYAASLAYSDVTNAIAHAAAGNTVQLPSGSAMWVNTVNVQGITLLGAGTNQTTIIDGTPLAANQIPLIAVNTTNLVLTRVSGFTVLSSNSSPVKYSGVITIAGTNPLVRVDHLVFYHNPAKPIQTLTQCNGLVDHCTFTMLATAANAFECDGNNYGDDAWSQPYTYGSSNAFYIEACTINCWPGANATIDIGNGGIVVARYNTFNFGAQLYVHGTESGQRTRSGRTFECYNNTFFYSTNQYDYFSAPSCVVSRGGSGIIFSNTSINYRYFTSLQSYRAAENSPNWQPWYGATGLNGYDSNSVTALSGTAGATSNALVVSGASWTINQWVGYTAYNSNLVNGINECGIVSSNNTMTMFFAQLAADYPIWQLQFTNSDPFIIHRAYPQIDQPGMGYGNLLSGSVPTPTWPAEHPEPVYCWSNNYTQYSGGGSLSGVATTFSQFPNVIEGRDFTNTIKPNYTPLVFPHPLDQ